MTGYCLLTGATGLLGRYLLRDLILKGTPVAALVRGQNGQSAEARISTICERWESELGQPLPRPVCIEGDITTPDLGISPAQRLWISRHCASVLHNAASLTFVGSDRKRDPWRSNLSGTEHVLALCKATGIRALHYMSTAFVCGKTAGPVTEDAFEHGQVFCNDYENAKFEAEKRVRSADFLERTTIYRPGIITGDSRTGYTSTYHGVYVYLQFVWLLSQYLEPDTDRGYYLPIRLNLTGDESHNFVPVDWVSAAASEIFHNSAHHGKTYHLTPSTMTTSRLIEEAMSRFYRYHGPTFVGPEALKAGGLNEMETSFYEYVGQYQPYWTQEPLFDRANVEKALPHLPCPAVDHACLTRMLDFAVKDNWGKRSKARKREVMTVT